jgi:UDP-glucose 4-epimerase
MKALITGGAGFIGSHLAEKLIQSGHAVTVIDDLSTGSLGNIDVIADSSRFNFVHDSVRNTKTMELLVEQCDVVFHLAAAVGVQLIVDKPVHTIETNIHGTEVVLETANRFQKKILITSSSEVYGKSESVPFHEDDDSILGSTMLARWSYACSKAIDEFLAFAYHDQYSLPVIVTRLFNTVGPRQTGQYGMVIPRFVTRALTNEPILIHGTGKQRRCFAYVEDIVEALIALMDCPGASGRVYNIGSTEEISIEALADKIIEMTGSKSKKKYISYKQAYGKAFDDMMRRLPSIDRIRQTIGYEPKTSLEKTLRIIIDDMKTKL